MCNHGRPRLEIKGVHLSQLALATIGHGDGSALLPHLLCLLGFTAVCFVIARRWLARSQ